MFGLFFSPTWAQNESMRAEPVRSARWFQTPGFDFYEGTKGTNVWERANFAPPHDASLELHCNA